MSIIKKRIKWEFCFTVGVLLLSWVFVKQLNSSMPMQASSFPANGEGICHAQIFLPTIYEKHIAHYFEGPEEIDNSNNNNDSLSANGPLRATQIYTGTLNDHRDYFSIYLQTDESLTATLTSSYLLNTNGVQFYLFYTKDQPQLVTPENIASFQLDHTTLSPYILSNTGAESSGWYFVYIYAAVPNNSATYSLVVDYQTPPPPTSIDPPSEPNCSPLSSSWKEVGVDSASKNGISQNNGDGAMYPSIALPPNSPERPLIAWSDLAGDVGPASEVYLKNWGASSWHGIGASAVDGGISDDETGSDFPSTTVTSNGTQYVTWENVGGETSDIYVKSWRGNSWEEIDQSASTNGLSNGEDSGYPVIATRPNSEVVYVAWQNFVEGPAPTIGRWEIYLLVTDGESWAEVGPTSHSASNGGVSNSPDNDSTHPSITVGQDDIVYIAWEEETDFGESEIFVASWDGDRWSGFGDSFISGISNTGHAHHPDIAVSGEGEIYVAWQDESSGANEIYLKRWNGIIWEEVVGSGNDGGLSNSGENGGEAKQPTNAVAPSGRPYVAWQDNRNGNWEVYILRLNEDDVNLPTWEEVGDSSASAGGVSNTPGSSIHPDLALSASNAYLTWQDNSSGRGQIYVRRWSGE